MKKRLVFVLLTLVLTSLTLSISVRAEVPDQAVKDFIDSLPDLVGDKLEKAPESPPEELYGVKFYLSFLASSVSDALPSLGGLLARLIGILILYAVAERLTSRARDAVALLFRFALSLLLLEVSEGCLSSALHTLADISHLAEGMTAVFLPLCLAGGNTAAAVAQSSGFSLFLFVTTFLSDRLLAPLVRAFLAFTLLGGAGGVDLSGFAATLKKTYLTLVSFVTLLFGFLLGTQTLFASAADSLSLRSVKLAVGNMIPVVGGTVSGALGTLLTSVGYLRSLVGGAATASLFVILLPPLLHLFFVRLSFSLAGDAAGIVGSGNGKRILSDFVSVFDILLATLALSALSLLLLVAALLKCAAIDL